MAIDTPQHTTFDTTTDPDGAARIRITGDLVVGNRERFKQHILELLHAGRRQFVLDCAACGYIDASGCGVLVSVAKRVREAGGELVIEHLNEDLCIMFELTKLDQIFVLRGTR